MRLLAASLMLLATAAPAGAVVSPHLRIEGAAPLVVSGSGFGPSDRITLYVSGGNAPSRLRARADGTFRVQLGRLHTFRCTAVVVVASSASGLKASARLPRPACLAPHPDASTQ